ncbi:MAG: ankyrin repeat domain-containing protein [Puniceicoccales bacterium]|jgi:hypothetical protein|nr:ankyrin repeat domain-containing protein [Puniceicoccales bacterium]
MRRVGHQLALAVREPIVDAARLANLASGIVVGKVGAVTIVAEKFFVNLFIEVNKMKENRNIHNKKRLIKSIVLGSFLTGGFAFAAMPSSARSPRQSQQVKLSPTEELVAIVSNIFYEGRTKANGEESWRIQALLRGGANYSQAVSSLKEIFLYGREAIEKILGSPESPLPSPLPARGGKSRSRVPQPPAFGSGFGAPYAPPPFEFRDTPPPAHGGRLGLQMLRQSGSEEDLPEDLRRRAFDLQDLLNDPEQRKNLNVRDQAEGRTLLCIAVEAYNLDSMELLLECEEIEVNIPNRNSLTPLHIAVMLGFYDGVKLLLWHPKTRVNAVAFADRGDTPLHKAVRENSLPTVGLLLTHPDIDVNIKNNDNLTPEELARRLRFHKIADLLAKFRTGEEIEQVKRIWSENAREKMSQFKGFWKEKIARLETAQAGIVQKKEAQLDVIQKKITQLERALDEEGAHFRKAQENIIQLERTQEEERARLETVRENMTQLERALEEERARLETVQENITQLKRAWYEVIDQLESTQERITQIAIARLDEIGRLKNAEAKIAQLGRDRENEIVRARRIQEEMDRALERTQFERGLLEEKIQFERGLLEEKIHSERTQLEERARVRSALAEEKIHLERAREQMA